jgi:hypothetical protein
MTGPQPNFFILGAPKCGTTSLARWLSEHPQVFIPSIKEPHYFSTDLRNRTVRTEGGYRKLFRNTRPVHRAVGEASTWYLFSRDAVPAIERTIRNARYVVLSRDPVEMVRSLHHHNLRVQNEDVPDLAEAWELQGIRRQGQRIPALCREPAFLQYREAAALGSQLQRLLRTVPSERVLHLSLETIRDNPAAAFRRVLAFLDVQDVGRTSFPIENSARGVRSRRAQTVIRLLDPIRRALGLHMRFGLSRFNDRAVPKADISAAMSATLARELAGERSILESFRREETDAAQTAQNASVHQDGEL